jgi:CYTH domain-containing protein
MRVSPVRRTGHLAGIHIQAATEWQHASAGDWITYAADVSRRTRTRRCRRDESRSVRMPAPSPEPGPAKYARIERERRFLLHGMPADKQATAVRKIADRYLTGTRLRLRHVFDDDNHDFKLTQKIPAAWPGPAHDLITTIYLSKAEYDLLAGLPAKTLTKTRHSVPPLGIDVFDPPLHGLVLAEAEFGTEAEMLAFHPPHYAVAEVTKDPRFTGGRLVGSSRGQLTSWLNDYGISLSTATTTRSLRRHGAG